MWSANTEPVLFEAKALELWRGDRCLFTDLQFEIGASQFLHVTGANGCGKTSLLRVLAGLSLPETGKVLWCGKDVLRHRTAFHHALAYVGHREGLKGDLHSEENIEFHVSLREQKVNAQAGGALQTMDIPRCATQAVRSLSAGQKRRVALARAVASSARLWLLDEPYANLDVAGRDLVVELLNRHMERGGLAVVAAHHDLPVTEGERVPLEMN